MSDDTDKKDSDDDAPASDRGADDAETGTDEAPPSKPSAEDADASSSDEEAADKPAAEGRRRTRRAAGRPAREDAPLVAEAEGQAAFKPSYVFLAVASVIFLALDLGTKWLAVKKLEENPDGKIVVVKYFFHFDLAHNKGGAWGLLGDQPDHVRLPFFFLISAVAVVFIVSLYRKLERRQTALKWALPLVLGGALGNLVDRIRHQYVVDFIDWFYVASEGKALVEAGTMTYFEAILPHRYGSHWPTFNVADVWIVAGVGLMIIDMFTPRKAVRKPVTRNVVKVPPKLTPKPKPSDEEAEGA